jgi:hypothetical protein
MDLSGVGGYFRFNCSAWTQVLELGRLFGWEPAGTVPDVDLQLSVRFGDEKGNLTGTEEEREQFAAEVRREWDGSYCNGGYFSNDFQVVTAEDATNLAEALERALLDVPGKEAIVHKLVRVEVPPQDIPGLHAMGVLGEEETSLETLPHDADVNPLEFFCGGDGKKKIRSFIAFCRAGKFRIG